MMDLRMDEPEKEEAPQSIMEDDEKATDDSSPEGEESKEESKDDSSDDSESK